MATETALDALNAALGDSAVSNNEPDEEVIVDDGTDAGTDEGVVPDPAEAAADESEGAEGEVAEGEEGSEPAAIVQPSIADEATRLGVSKNRPNGTFKSREEFAADVKAAQAAEKAAAKPADKATAKPQIDPATGKPVAKKPADPINDPIPQGVAKETQDRIRTLIDRTKQAEEKHADIQRNFDYMVEGVKATGASPEQYGETLSWLSLFNSGDPASQGKALEIIEGLADQLSTMLGVERKVADPLAAHPDLQQAVQKGQLTAQYAKEMARQRNAGAFRTQLTTAQRTQQEQESAANQEKEAARVELNTLEESLRASDPLYDQKKAQILPTLKIMFPQIRPGQWKATFQQLYREVKVAPRTLVRRQGVPQNQPMRAGRNPAGSGAGATMSTQSQPKTAMDALNAALARK